MARRPQETPTEAELEILKILWERGPSTGRQVLDVLAAQRKRAYTSVMSVLNIMADKGQVIRKPQGRAFIYSAKRPREKTLGKMVGSLLGRAFEGSAASLVAQLLDQSKPTPEELDEIRKTIEQYGNRSNLQLLFRTSRFDYPRISGGLPVGEAAGWRPSGHGRSAAILLGWVAHQSENLALDWREFSDHHRPLIPVDGQRMPLHVVEGVEYAGGRGTPARPTFGV